MISSHERKIHERRAKGKTHLQHGHYQQMVEHLGAHYLDDTGYLLTRNKALEREVERLKQFEGRGDV